MSTMLHRLCHDDAGQDMVEYALLCSLLSIVGIYALRVLGLTIMKKWSAISSNL